MQLFLWLCSLLLFAPPLTVVAGRVLARMVPLAPHGLLQVSLAAAAVAVTAGFVLCRKTVAARMADSRPSRFQVVTAVVFALAVALPRMTALGTDVPVAIYDDHWHCQKIVSVFGSFPALEHYFFPDLPFSYYFYAYIIPAALYTLKAGLNLKLIWALYVFIVAACISLLLMICFNRFLPRPGWSRPAFALSITFMGGLHEWPVLVYAWSAGLGNWHTEWWASSLGLRQQVSSFYSNGFWAPQHVCGLAFFGLIFRLVRSGPLSALTAFGCGLLLGIQAGFSAYTALFTGLFTGLCLAPDLVRRPGHFAVTAASAGAGLLLGLAPVLGCYAGRGETFFLAGRLSSLPAYLAFLTVELGALLILFACYCRRGPNAPGKGVNILFIALTFLLIFCFESRGFNVFSYRSALPAQLLLCFAGAAVFGEVLRFRKAARAAVVLLLCVQVSGFVPEMLAMTKKNIDSRKQSARLPENIVRINREAPFDELFSIPYRKNLQSLMLNVQVHNLFRMKNVARRFYCEKQLDANNLVYLDRRSVEALKAECRDGGAGQQPLIGAVPKTIKMNRQRRF